MAKRKEKGLSIKEKSGIWHIEGRLLGIQVRKSTRLPAKDAYYVNALKALNEIERQIVNGSYGTSTPENYTVGEAIDLYREWKRGVQKSLSRKHDKVLENHRKIFGHLLIRELTIEAQQIAILKQWPHLKPNSIDRYMTDLASAVHHGCEAKGIHPPRILKANVDDSRDVHLDGDEVNVLLTWMEENYPCYFPHFLALIDTGVRLNELLQLSRPSFDTREGVVKVRRKLRENKGKQKTQTRTIALTPDLKRLILSGRIPPSGPAFPDNHGLPWLNASKASAYLGDVLRECVKATGITPLRVHDLRHTFAYLIAQAGGDLGDLQILMGHTDISQTMRYRGFVKSRAASAIRSARAPLSDMSDSIDNTLSKKTARGDISA